MIPPPVVPPVLERLRQADHGQPGSNGQHAESEHEAWPKPVYFITPPPRAGLPDAMVGTLVGDLATMVLGAWGIPPLMTVTVALGVASSATRGRFRAAIGSGAEFPLALYLMPLATPGSLKSPLLAALTRELAERQQDTIRAHAPTLAKALQERDAHAKAINVQADALANALAGKKGDPDVIRAELDSLTRAQSALDQPVGMDVLALGADLTYEAMINRAERNGGRVAVLSAEGTLIENLAGRTSDGMPKSEFLNSAYDAEPYHRERIGDGTHSIASPWASLLFCVQPDVMVTVLGSQHMRRRGFLQRFLFASIPTVTYRSRHDLPQLAGSLLTCWDQQISSIWTRPRDEEDVVLGPGVGALVLRDFERDVIAGKVAKAQDRGDDLLVGWLAKLAMTTVRVAAVVQLVEDPASTEVGTTAAHAANGFATAMIEHVEHLFIRSPQALAASPRGRVLQWMTHPDNTDATDATPGSVGSVGSVGVGRHVTTRAVHVAFQDQAWCDSASDVRDVLVDLVALGWISGPTSVTGPKGGRPSERWQLHPQLAEHHEDMLRGAS